MNNRAYSDNTIRLDILAERLEDLLPETWVVGVGRGSGSAEAGVLTVAVPNTAPLELTVKMLKDATPAGVDRVLQAVRAAAAEKKPAIERVVIAAPFIGPGLRVRIRDAGVSYFDLTGNVLLRADSPPIFVSATGADKNPWPGTRAVRSLRGAKASQIVRVLIDYRAPLGVRQIAATAEVDPGYVSRVLDLLASNGFVDRDAQGGVAQVRWDQLLEYWTQDYSVFKSHRHFLYIDPRGLNHLKDQLRTLDPSLNYAVTGSLTASRYAPVAPARLGIVYVDDVRAVSSALGLVPAEAGANVLLVEPKGSFVYDRAKTLDGIRYVAPSQAAVDLLTGSGRNPSEGTELIEWMRRNEQSWRT